MKPASEEAKKRINNAIEHLSKHCSRLDYASAGRAGRHMGSGAIESANKMICHGRLKRTGTWWYPSCANNVLELRRAKYNGTYDRVIELYRERHPITAVRRGNKQGVPGTDTAPPQKREMRPLEGGCRWRLGPFQCAQHKLRDFQPGRRSLWKTGDSSYQSRCMSARIPRLVIPAIL